MTSSRLFNLPAEIIQLIYDFAAPYVDIKQKVLKELLFEASIQYLDKEVLALNVYLMDSHIRNRRRCRRMNHVDSDGFLSRGLISYHLRETFSKKNICNMFSNVSSCHCCKMHTSNSPKTISDTWDEQPLCPVRPSSIQGLCNCKCRHYKRILVNSYHLFSV